MYQHAHRHDEFEIDATLVDQFGKQCRGAGAKVFQYSADEIQKVMDAIKAHRLPRSVLSWIGENGMLSNIWWENVPTEDITGGFFASSRATSAARPSFLSLPLPPISVTVHPLSVALMYLCGCQHPLIYARFGMEYRQFHTNKDGMLGGSATQIIPAFTELVDASCNQHQSSSAYGPGATPTICALPLVALTHVNNKKRWKILASLLHVLYSAAQSSDFSGSGSLRSIVSAVPSSSRFLFLLSRFLIHMLNHSSHSHTLSKNGGMISMTSGLSLGADQNESEAIRYLLLAFIQSALLAQHFFQRSHGDTAGDAYPTVPASDGEGSTDAHRAHMTIIHCFSLIQACYQQLEMLLKCLTLGDLTSENMSNASVGGGPCKTSSDDVLVSIPSPSQLFHGRLFHHLVAQSLTAESKRQKKKQKKAQSTILNGEGAAVSQRRGPRKNMKKPSLAGLLQCGLLQIPERVAKDPTELPHSDLNNSFAALAISESSSSSHHSTVAPSSELDGLSPPLMCSVIDDNAEKLLRKAWNIHKESCKGDEKMQKQNNNAEAGSLSHSVSDIAPVVPASRAVVAAASASAISQTPTASAVPVYASVGLLHDGPYRPFHSLCRLPIDNLLPQIYQNIQSHPLTLVNAATGSGKSSRIPAMLVRQWYARDQVKLRASARKDYQRLLPGHPLPASLRWTPQIIVTQPRRIAAISLARRVADELAVNVGEDVGDKIGADRQSSESTKLHFVTTGWLLQKLIHDPGYLAQCSAICLDEIHERGIDADILMVVMKRSIAATAERQRRLPSECAAIAPAFPRIILMSATFDTDLLGP